MALFSRKKACRPGFLPCFLLILTLLWGRWDFGTTLPWANSSAPAEEATPESTIAEGPVQDRALHLARLGVERWHKAGQRGQGLKIAVLDSGFRGYQVFLGKALPERVTVRSFRADRNLEARDSQHGVLCAEVLHALAPAAEILLANWESDNPQSFLEAVRWARDQGARIISCSLIMPSWSDGEGGGPVHAEMARLLGSGEARGDLLFFACAGNTAQRHWAGSFRPDGEGFHQWSQGQTTNSLRPWGRERVAVELYGPLGSAYDLQVFDSASGALVGQTAIRGHSGQSSTSSQKPKGYCGVVRFLPKSGHTYQVRLRGAARPGLDDKFHLVILGGTLERSTLNGSIPFPADGAGVQAVGAVDSGGRRFFYSSCGPNSIRPKPDFVAPVPFASLCRERAFAGTSAAAPQAAGLAALLLSRHPDWTPQQVRQSMRQSARDLGPPGHDWETGYGLIQLP